MLGLFYLRRTICNRFHPDAGEYDFICNWLGNFHWTQTLEWSGASAFTSAENTTWVTASGEEAGTFISADGFTFLKVLNAGHMVPRDQPQNSLDMVLKHITQFWTSASAPESA